MENDPVVKFLFSVVMLYLAMSGGYVGVKLCFVFNNWLKKTFGGKLREEVEQLRDEVDRLKRKQNSKLEF